jgi:hypothetical protein
MDGDSKPALPEDPAEEPPRTIVATYADGKGKTTRPAVLIQVVGRSLLGPATFPVWGPKLYRGEKLKRSASGGWVIEGVKVKKKAR